jgi:hypothetical protein
MQNMGSPGMMTQDMRATAGRSKKELAMDQQLDMYKQQRDAGMPRGPMRQ